MGLLSKAWNSPPAPVSGPTPVTGPSPVTQQLVSLISAQAFRMKTTPRPTRLPSLKEKPDEFVPRIFPSVVLHGVVIQFDQESLAQLKKKREDVGKNIKTVLDSGRRKIQGVEIRDIIHGLTRSTLNSVRGRLHSIYDERNSALDVGNLDFTRSYHIQTYRPYEDLNLSTTFETLVLSRHEKKFQNGVIHTAYKLTDPSFPCDWPGTTEFGEFARAITHKLSGKSCPKPCYTCSCTGKIDLELP